jgi:hypothetical protein
MSLEEANTSYKIDTLACVDNSILKYLIKDNFKCFVYEGNLTIDGDINLDYKFKSSQGQGSCLYVTGNLVVKGNVANAEGDYGNTLIVKGNLAAKNLIGGGCYIGVEGDSCIEGAIIGHYNHGTIKFLGATKAHFLQSDDHDTDVRNFTGIDLGDSINFNNEESLTWDFYLDELFEEDGDEDEDPYLDIDGLIKCLLNNQPVAKPNPVAPYDKLVKRLEEAKERGDESLELSLWTTEKKLPDSIFTLTTLKKLNLNYCGLTQLDDGIGNLINLEELELNNNRSLTKLPTSVKNLIKLHTLNIDDTNIDLSTITSLKGLKNLFMDNVPLTTITPNFANLSQLEQLTMCNCYIAIENNIELPHCITTLKKLGALQLAGTTFSSLGNNFTNLTNLEVLGLSEALAFMTELPDFSKLTKLVELEFTGHTQVGSWPNRKDFYPDRKLLHQLLSFKMSALEELTLDDWGGACDDNNQVIREEMTELPDLFDNVPKLKQLSLSGSFVKTPPPSLVKLIKHNKIEVEF